MRDEGMSAYTFSIANPSTPKSSAWAMTSNSSTFPNIMWQGNTSSATYASAASIVP